MNVVRKEWAMTKRLVRVVWCVVIVAGLWGCSDDTSGNGANSGAGSNAGVDGGGGLDGGGVGGGLDGGGVGGGLDGGSGGTDAGAGVADLGSSPFDVDDMGQVLCGDVPCACSNGQDDDGDGLVDGFDPECTGPYDDDESTFATGISGDNKDPVWQDCFFDGNSGSGDDKCRYHVDCLTGAAGPDDSRCQISDECRDNCQKFAPNGCDCFGCCTLFGEDGSSKSVIIGTECSVDKLDDPVACPVCVPTTECGNACGTCELCPGRGVDDLPDECFSSGGEDMGAGGGEDAGGSGGPADAGSSGGGDEPAYTCDEGETVCESGSDCTYREYCALGCCIEIPL